MKPLSPKGTYSPRSLSRSENHGCPEEINRQSTYLLGRDGEGGARGPGREDRRGVEEDPRPEHVRDRAKGRDRARLHREVPCLAREGTLPVCMLRDRPLPLGYEVRVRH